ncbi:MAG: AAA family ATPase, partial [Bacteriovoracia bacterium]
MRLQKLYFRNFRNIAELTIEPDGRLNFFIGANAQGKTSIIEAIHLLATLRSFRGAKVDDLIQNETMTGEIGCEIIQDDSISRFQVVFERKDLLRKRSTQSAFINDKPCRSALAYVSQRFESFLKGFHAIVFNPSDHHLVRGEPSIRRSYLDQVIGSEDLDYLTALRRYKRALEQ